MIDKISEKSDSCPAVGGHLTPKTNNDTQISEKIDDASMLGLDPHKKFNQSYERLKRNLKNAKTTMYMPSNTLVSNNQNNSINGFSLTIAGSIIVNSNATRICTS